MISRRSWLIKHISILRLGRICHAVPPSYKYLDFKAWLIVDILLATPPCVISFARASSSALCVILASSKSLKLLPMLGVPSLPSFAARRCLGDNVDKRVWETGRCDCGCDWAEEEDEWTGCFTRWGSSLSLFEGPAVGRRDGGVFCVILTVAPGSPTGGGVFGLVLDNGRNGEASSSSSSASDRMFGGAFAAEYLGLRAKARLRTMGCGAPDSDELEESLAIADGLEAFSVGGRPCLGDASAER